VELKNLTFENELRRNRDSNVKFAPLECGGSVLGRLNLGFLDGDLNQISQESEPCFARQAASAFK
jgi:hypothetical protein